MMLPTGMVRRIYVQATSAKSETNQTIFELLHYTYLHNTRSFTCRAVLHIDHVLAEKHRQNGYKKNNKSLLHNKRTDSIVNDETESYKKDNCMQYSTC